MLQRAVEHVMVDIDIERSSLLQRDSKLLALQMRRGIARVFLASEE